MQFNEVPRYSEKSSVCEIQYVPCSNLRKRYLVKNKKKERERENKMKNRYFRFENKYLRNIDL